MSAQSVSSPRRAVVIGASIAGLTAARVLAEHLDEVILLDRDETLDGERWRKGVPQGRHVHALLAAGQAVLERWLPGLSEDFRAAGAIFPNIGTDASWHVAGGYRPRYRSAISPTCLSRPAIERAIRARVLAHPKISLRQGVELQGYITDEAAGRIQAVRVRRREDGGDERISATLVIDASGRGSRTPALLGALGLPVPEETVVVSRAAYATRHFTVREDQLQDWKFCYVQPLPGQSTRGGIAAPIEGGQFIVTLIGMAGDHPPTDEAGFLAFADSLPTPQLAAFIRAATPCSPIYGFARAENRLRHYEALPRTLDGLLVLGDAACALNPVYGQGMTVAALAGDVLDGVLKQARRGEALEIGGLSRRFQRALADVLKLPWQLATGEDTRWPIPENRGGQPLPKRMLTTYIDQIQRASLSSPYLCEAFYRVSQMIDGPAALFRPGVVLRVLASLFQRPRALTQQPGLGNLTPVKERG